MNSKPAIRAHPPHQSLDIWPDPYFWICSKHFSIANMGN